LGSIVFSNVKNEKIYKSFLWLGKGQHHKKVRHLSFKNQKKLQALHFTMNKEKMGGIVDLNIKPSNIMVEQQTLIDIVVQCRYEAHINLVTFNKI